MKLITRFDSIIPRLTGLFDVFYGLRQIYYNPPIYSELYRAASFFYEFLIHPPVTSALLMLQIFCSTLSSLTPQPMFFT
jgi:hypothetical protein